jgi:hypothetical protein
MVVGENDAAAGGLWIAGLPVGLCHKLAAVSGR